MRRGPLRRAKAVQRQAALRQDDAARSGACGGPPSRSRSEPREPARVSERTVRCEGGSARRSKKRIRATAHATGNARRAQNCRATGGDDLVVAVVQRPARCGHARRIYATAIVAAAIPYFCL